MTTANPPANPTIAALHRRLREAESLCWIMALLVKDSEIPAIDAAELQAEADAIHAQLEELARRIARTRNIRTVGSVKASRKRRSLPR